MRRDGKPAKYIGIESLFEYKSAVATDLMQRVDVRDDRAREARRFPPRAWISPKKCYYSGGLTRSYAGLAGVAD